MAHADLTGIEHFDDSRSKVGQLQSGCDESRRLAHLRSDLFDAVLRVFQVEEGAKAVGFFHRVNVAALEVFDLSLVLQKLSMTSTTMESCTL